MLTFVVLLQAQIPSNYYPPTKIKEYRNSVAAASGGGTNGNLATPRSATAFLSVNNTNNATVVTTYSTATITTNVVTASQLSGIYVPQGNKFTLSVISDSDLPIRSMTVQVIFRAVFPIGGSGIAPLGFTVTKDSIPPLTLGLSPFTGGAVSVETGKVGTVTFDPAATIDIATLGTFQVFTNDTTATVPLMGGATYSTFVGQSAKGTWSVQMSTPSASQGSNFFQGFTVSVTSDPSSVTINGQRINVTPRRLSETHPTALDGTPFLSRRQTEK